ncbi:response regulator transcription factor [Nocardioides anomalus]|uniref:Response regulator transcription factor n=1 Tax=Nocardioides anomalus TaxID=2712223 RepID=A0A6G6WC96_9ACTN|nr:response regulator transcription factor [Nocardioides anomalus]QIG42773.1 response regulator transcription factor [Nocardioides anomalus]
MNAPSRGSDHPLAVGVYDEPELIVTGVGAMLARSGASVEVVKVTADGEPPAVDVLLCDPIGRTMQLEEYLTRVVHRTTAPVLVFTWTSSPSNLRRSLAAGARGFVSKSASAQDLADAVAAVSRGETVAPTGGRIGAQPGMADLSAREAEVLELICRGLSNLEIADRLFVSVNSVKTYVRQIYQKIGVARRSQAVAWGLAHGF